MVKASDIKITRRHVDKIPEARRTSNFGQCPMCGEVRPLVRSKHKQIVVMVCEECKERYELL
jgi:transcription elongation factor Elf1